MDNAALIVLAVLEAVVIVVLLALRRRSRRWTRVLQEQLESMQSLEAPRGRRRMPTGRDAVKAVIETAALVREKGLGGAIRSSIEELAGWAEVERPDLERLAAGDGTVTIAFSDIEDSTALNDQLGDRSWMKVLAAHDRIVRGQVDHHAGQVVKSQGDGFMIAFGDADAAVRCAIDVQRALAKRGGRTPVRVRIGIHKGDAVHRDGDLFGRNVTHAARVASHAEGGQILVSDAVSAALADELAPLLGDGRLVELKGFSGEHTVFPVSWADED